MARPRKLVPALCHHRAKHLAYVTIDGKPRYLGPWDRQRDRPSAEAMAAYKRLAVELTAAGGLDLADLPGPPTVAELIAAYLIDARAQYRGRDGNPTSEWATIKGALQYLLDLYGDVDADAFRPRQLKAVRARMIEAGLARKVINRHIERMRAMFAFGVVDEVVHPDTLARLREVRGLRKWRGGRETAPRRPVAWTSVRPVLLQVSRQVRSMILLQWLTGMRPGEVIQLRAERVRTDLDLWMYDFGDDHKTAHLEAERIVIFGARARKLLAAWLVAKTDGYLFQPTEAAAEQRALRRRNRKTPLYPSHVARYRRQHVRRPRRPPGECYTIAAYRRCIGRACKAAGIPSWSPNQLRHAFATRIADLLDGKLDVVAAAMGHANVSTTQIYAHLQRHKAELVARVAG